MKRRAGNPKLAVAYVRVSTSEQDLGPKAQREAIGQWARSQGVRVVRWRVEKVSGGAPPEKRPRLLMAINDLRDVDAGVLVVWKRDRFMRASTYAIAATEKLIEERGGRLYSTDGISNGDTPEAELVRRVLDAVAAYERQMTKLRTAAAAQVLRRRGAYAGGAPPFGYVRGPGGKLVRNDSEARTLEMIRALHGAGMRAPTIASLLNKDRVPCRGSKWHARSVRRILRRNADLPLSA